MLRGCATIDRWIDAGFGLVWVWVWFSDDDDRSIDGGRYCGEMGLRFVVVVVASCGYELRLERTPLYTSMYHRCLLQPVWQLHRHRHQETKIQNEVVDKTPYRFIFITGMVYCVPYRMTAGIDILRHAP